MKGQPTFRIARSLDDLVKVFIVRAIVFMDEQHVSYGEEMDDQEHAAVHLLGEVDAEPIAAGRVRFSGSFAKLERLAVRREWRGRGYGSDLLRFAMQVASEAGFRQFKLHAQLATRDFYRKHGFQVRGRTFVEAGIEHCLMVRANAADGPRSETAWGR